MISLPNVLLFHPVDVEMFDRSVDLLLEETFRILNQTSWQRPTTEPASAAALTLRSRPAGALLVTMVTPRYQAGGAHSAAAVGGARCTRCVTR